MKAIPNCISVSRIVLSIALLIVEPLSPTFYTIYVICGLSDMADGYIARKFKLTSKLGTRLDSIADLIMTAVLFIILVPLISLTTGIILWVMAIGVIRILSITVAFIKYKSLAILHTYGNKITGMALFLFPLLLFCVQSTALVYIICVIASVSAVEELAIHLISSQLQLNKQSIFSHSADH